MSYTALLCLSIFAIYAVVWILMVRRDYIEKHWPERIVRNPCTCRADNIAAHRPSADFEFAPSPTHYIRCRSCRARDTHVTQA